MYVVVGVSGNTGGATARQLLERGASVRAVVRDPANGKIWEDRGAQVAVADLADSSSLAAAFQGARAAYVLNPPAYTIPDIFERAETLARRILRAVRQARLPRLVVLSSIGAHLATGSGNIRTNRTFEQILGDYERTVVFLRPAYFMENWGWVAPAASEQGILPSFLSPLDRAIPMVSAADIGRAAADVMSDSTPGTRPIELEGPKRCSPNDAAQAFQGALGRPVTAVAVPPAQWPAVLEGSNFSPCTIQSWVELFHGFNSGRIDFERPTATVRGRVSIGDAIGAIARRK